jgi:hypothetical protein
VIDGLSYEQDPRTAAIMGVIRTAKAAGRKVKARDVQIACSVASPDLLKMLYPGVAEALASVAKRPRSKPSTFPSQ